MARGRSWGLLGHGGNQGLVNRTGGFLSGIIGSRDEVESWSLTSSLASGGPSTAAVHGGLVGGGGEIKNGLFCLGGTASQESQISEFIT